MFGHLNPIVTLLHNQKLNRWHPVVYLESPMPGKGFEADGNTTLVRHKSKMHHTTGLETREAALDNARELLKQCDGTKTAFDEDIAWDGEDVPADVAFFEKVAGEDLTKYKRVM